MSKREPLRRDAITRARFFLEQARSCLYSDDMAWQEPFEAYLEAAIVFSRAAVHRLQNEKNVQPLRRQAALPLQGHWRQGRHSSATRHRRRQLPYAGVHKDKHLGSSEDRRRDRRYYEIGRAQ